ncbi:CHAT domain-containing protein [Calothrix rhizosoleniae]|uniref:CHAT domain-containing protein n=1 Tax=Calothrix rhizosoleniae TaxID=888997 RepID=UPI000B4A11F4|nr:CHAT domain-containing protein [Calothrix rhizosoleniae]
MSQSDSSSTENIFHISHSSIKNLAGSGSIYDNEGIGGADKQNSPTSARQPKAPTVRTILFLAANPKDTAQLRLDEEVREIDASLQRARGRDQFVLQQRWAVRSRDVQRAMLDFRPQIVHFSGHGAEEGLVLEDKTGKAKFVDTEGLAGLFKSFSDCVECVVLNACYSEVQADAIARHIPYVIGMNKAIGDKAAIEFAVSLYDALGVGESVEFAYKFGCSNIRMAGIPEHLTPVLKKKSS